MKWTARRLALASAIRALQIATGDRDAHTRLQARWRRWREDRRGTPRLTSTPVDPRRILVCKTEQRGDVILSIPALRALRARFPSAHLAVLGAPWAVEILAAVPEVSETLVLEHPPIAFEASRPASTDERAALVRTLACANFDLAVDLTGDTWTVELLAEAGIPMRIGVAETGASHLLQRSIAISPRIHRIEAMLAIANLAGASAADATPRLAPTEAARRECERATASMGLAEPFVVVHPGGRALKRWPLERWAELVDRMSGEIGDAIVLIFGPDEADLGAAFAGATRSGRVKVWPGGSFLAVGELLRRARLYVGNDSGVAHLAAAVGATTVTILGPTRVSRWAPRAERGVALSTDESCAYPCWPSIYREDCSHHRCVRKITVERVMEAIRNLGGSGSIDPTHEPEA
jgi:ADP-heptose:LPS heptosyltransferase